MLKQIFAKRLATTKKIYSQACSLIQSYNFIYIHIVRCIIYTEGNVYKKILNVTIPEDIAKRFDKIPNKSKFISEAIKEKLDKLEAQKLKELLSKSYKAVKEEDKIVSEEWESVTLEGLN